MRRLAVSFATIVALLGVAAVLGLLLVVFPGGERDAGEDAAVALADAGADGTGGAGGAGGADGAVERVSDAVERAVARAAEQARAAAVLEARVRSLDGLVIDGAAAGEGQARAIASAPVDYLARISFIDQRTVLASGCEVAALCVALNSTGHAASVNDIADHHLKTGVHVSTDYLGSPYVNGGGLPPCIVDAGNSWLAKQASRHRVVNTTATSFDAALALTQLGYPVVTWVTIGLVQPQFTGPVENGLQWYRPEHCVVLYGIEGSSVLVSDSLEGFVKRDRAQFERIYTACGSKSLVVL